MCSPRPGEEPKDEVHLHDEPSLVKKLNDKLEKVIADLCDRVVLGIQIPTFGHPHSMMTSFRFLIFRRCVLLASYILS